MTEHPEIDAPAAAPDEIVALAAERAEARRERDFTRADALRSRIEAAGWKVVDDGARSTLTPARPPDRIEDGRVVFASPASVPSRLEMTAGPGMTVVVIADDRDGAPASAVGARLAGDVDVVVVAADGPIERADLLDRLLAGTAVAPVEVGAAAARPGPVEVLWVTEAMGPAAALAAGLRRVGQGVVAVVEAGVVIAGDPLGPIAAALADPSVAAVGIDGLTSADLHRFTAAGPDDPIVAIGSALLGFRRADVSRLEAIDERLGSWGGVVAWSSLALREGTAAAVSRRVVLVDLAVSARPSPSEVARRDRYRIAARFAEDGSLSR